MRVLAFDHRAQFQALDGATPDRIGAFKALCLHAVEQVAAGRPGHGILCDDRIGRSTLHAAAETGLWLGRPVEAPGTRPLALEPDLGPDCGGLGQWPKGHVVKCLCFCHPDDDAAMWEAQLAVLSQVFTAARRQRLEVLLEVIPSRVGPVDDRTTPRVIDRIYGAGLYPDWWKLEPLTTRAAWAAVIDAIQRHDPHTRGILVLGLDAPESELAASFATAAAFPLVRGFAVGRTIFGAAGRDWMAGRMTDAQAVSQMAEGYARLCRIWDAARGNG
jgi:5-dehydro-2-deoxygluconokinase